MIDQAGCCHKIERSDGFSFVSVLSKCHVCLFFLCFSTFLLYFFSFPFEINTIPLNTGEWLQSPIRMEYKLYQSATATAASDKSLSDTLMPSNCLWRPLPVCSPSQTHAQPHPSTSQPALPFHCSSAPCSGYCSVGFESYTFQSGCPRVDSTPLKWVVLIVPQVCGRCSHLLPRCLSCCCCFV